MYRIFMKSEITMWQITCFRHRNLINHINESSKFLFNNFSFISESSRCFQKRHHRRIILSCPTCQEDYSRLLLYYWCTSRYQDSLLHNWPNDNRILFAMDPSEKMQFQAVSGVFTKITKRVDSKLKKCKMQVSHIWTVDQII